MKCNICLFTGSKSGPIDLIFGIPSTTELGSEGFDSFKSFIKKVTNSYPISEGNTNVGIIKYGSKAEVVLPLSEGTSSQTLNQRLDGINFSPGVQNVPEALQLAADEMFTSAGGGRSGASKYFVFGAGSESNTPEALEKASRKLKYQGVSIMPISIGSDVSPLRSIASQPVRDFYRTTTDASSLETDLHTQVVSSVVPGRNLEFSNSLIIHEQFSQ